MRPQSRRGGRTWPSRQYSPKKLLKVGKTTMIQVILVILRPATEPIRQAKTYFFANRKNRRNRE